MYSGADRARRAKKNLTQLPWSGKGSKAKNDNTLGRMHGGIRYRIGSMTD